jgi:hypothetical protein
LDGAIAADSAVTVDVEGGGDGDGDGQRLTFHTGERSPVSHV